MSFFRKKRIYLDYASATPLSRVAKDAMLDAYRSFGNPNAYHSEGEAAKRVLEEARTKIARELSCKSRDIVFTSGITEANNIAILGVARKMPRNLSGTHWIVSSIEHASVLECFREIEELGGNVTYLSTDARGLIAALALKRELRRETVLVSVGWGNNEIGAVQHLPELARVIGAHERANRTRVLFHSDAGQAPLYLSPNVHSLGVDLFSLGSTKVHGPSGIGALYISSRAELSPLVRGGGQERSLRSGTQSIALAAGFAAALSEADEMRHRESLRIGALRDRLRDNIQEAIPEAVVNGNEKSSLPHVLNVSLPLQNAEYFMLALDRAGVAVSTKSACDEGESKESHVVRALVRAGGGGDEWRARGALRLSLGRLTSLADIERAGAILIDLWSRVGTK